MPEPETANLDGSQPNHHRGSLFGSVRKAQLPSEFIAPGGSLGESLVRSYLEDINSQNAVDRFYAWCLEFNDEEGIRLLKFHLDGTRAIKGRGTNSALMGHTQILVPEVMGATKTEKDAIRRENDRREKIKRQEDQHET